MSSKQRGTKRAADAPASGPKSKSFKPAPGQGSGKDFRGKPGGKFGKPGQPDGKFGKPAGKFGKPAGKFGGKPAGKPFKPAPKKERQEKHEEPARRKRPVTQGGGDEDVDMSGDEEDGDELDGEPEAEAEAGPEEKRGKMSKTERAALHAAQPHRKTLLPSHALLTETLLPLWETARRVEMPKDERTAAITELWAAVQGHVLEISRGHKGGRILQTIVKYGGKEERLGVAMELQPKWREMMESKYSKFLMGKLIRYCPSIRPLLVPVIAKNLGSLLAHADAVQPISDFYDLYASAKERRGLVRGFYPREVELFDGADGTDYPGLEAALEATSESGRVRVLEGVERVVLEIFNATQKTALAQPIFHRLVHEYLTALYAFHPDATTKMHELLAASLESLPEIVHTKDGSAVVRELLVRGTAKDRKSILQQLRKHIPAIAKDGDAQLVLFTALDVVDDTKLMAKAFVSDLVAIAHDLAGDKHGRRALLYLLSPSSRHFLPATLTSLASSSATAHAGTSKKDAAVRRRELLAAASPGLLALVAEHADTLVRDPGSGLLVTEILLHATGDKGAAIDALARPLAAEYGDEHPLHLAHATRTYKTLLAGGHFSHRTGAIEVVDPLLGRQLAQAMWTAICEPGDANAVAVAAGAPFVVLELLAAMGEGEDAVRVLRDGVLAIEEGGMKGAGVLVERIRA
ncbi:hypothetical protein CspeluHIS016_0204770 [Cutaneotrichosporon spelunceum]|uniref:PUM-HD domain-containing protein n=1 Tax=Cutaneotrichosporon spelunceum TaxID=1672016 RepID=A0AAD3TR62_9TREE|nr:hypothetical protein CspeluHIS016_0204770 [Cutaneotrichosporon spelunceum]